MMIGVSLAESFSGKMLMRLTKRCHFWCHLHQLHTISLVQVEQKSAVSWDTATCPLWPLSLLANENDNFCPHLLKKYTLRISFQNDQSGCAVATVFGMIHSSSN